MLPVAVEKAKNERKTENVSVKKKNRLGQHKVVSERKAKVDSVDL